jgi:Domain of unknown function (DUF932)
MGVDLKSYVFPVEETSVYFANEAAAFANKSLTKNYKAIVRSDNKKLISIMPKTYKLVPNDILIREVLDKLEKTDQKYYIDPTHSFVDDKRMRLQLTFPELTLADDESKTAMSLFVHNSYDGSEGVRGYWGAIRGICSNGMIFGKVLCKFYHRHTHGFFISDMKELLEKAYDAIPEIQERFNALQRIELKSFELKSFQDKIEKEMGKKVVDDLELRTLLASKSTNAYAILQALTWVVSHNIEARRRAFYQQKIAKIMEI